ncbi:MAG: zinc-binding dehydrogenase [Pseudonocardia sp.]|nr:zinc-binding dehydrogenase [Pseudonocardia sp.]
MRAIVQERFGPPEVLGVAHVPDPVPGPGQVRIRVAAAGVHLIDTKLRAGQTAGPAPAAPLPFTPGREVAGTVDALGDGVDGDWWGARVSAHLGPTGSGGYAEATLADVTALHRLPDHIEPDAAVAMLGTGRMTMGLLELARPSADDIALVTSAAGGIGILLVQALRAAGAGVIAVAGTGSKLAIARTAGADTTADYADPGWADDLAARIGDRRPTLVFDGLGGTPGRAAFDLLAPGGRTLLYGWSAGEPTAFTSRELYARGLTAVVALGPPIMALGMRRLEDRALAALSEGTLSPAVARFPLDDAAEAHRALEERRTSGKVVLVPA